MSRSFKRNLLQPEIGQSSQYGSQHVSGPFGHGHREEGASLTPLSETQQGCQQQTMKRAPTRN